MNVAAGTGPATPRRRRRRVLLLAAASALVIIVALLALFEPWKLWVDDVVDQVAPVGAVPITAPGVPTTDEPAQTSPPDTAATVPPDVTASTATPTTATTTAPTTTAPTTAPTVAPIPVGGEFRSLDHGTSGTIVLLQDPDGTRYVRLENLETSNGPDLFVYLSTNPVDGPEGEFDDEYVNLGGLQGNIGSQNYVVPPGTDLSRYASVVIWCDRFDSAFGAAPLT